MLTIHGMQVHEMQDSLVVEAVAATALRAAYLAFCTAYQLTWENLL
jgi:hypothetical protein